MIVGRNQGVSLRFISSLQLWKRMRKGCNLYAILALNDKGMVEGLENLLVVQEFVDEIPSRISRCVARSEYRIYHRPKTWNLTNGNKSLLSADP